MNEVSIIGLDAAKNVFLAHGAGAAGPVVFRRTLSRAQLLKCLGQQPFCIVAMEARASAYHWGRASADLGHGSCFRVEQFCPVEKGAISGQV